MTNLYNVISHRSNRQPIKCNKKPLSRMAADDMKAMLEAMNPMRVTPESFEIVPVDAQPAARPVETASERGYRAGMTDAQFEAMVNEADEHAQAWRDEANQNAHPM